MLPEDWLDWLGFAGVILVSVLIILLWRIVLG